MEANQTSKMIAWLDEERRKDKALITRLEERSASQSALITEQARRIRELEGKITGLKASIPSVSNFEEAVTRLRSEVTQNIEQLETKRSTTDLDLKKMRDTDREGLMKAVEELRQEMIERIDRAMQPRRTEEERLSRVAVELQSYANNLSRGLEEFERSLTFLEEQRRQDTRRISDLNGEIAEISKRTDSYLPKIELLEELSRRNERAVSEFMPQITEIKQQHQQWVEEQALAEQQRERTMNDMIRRMDSFAEEMVGFEKQVQGWADTHRSIKVQVEDWGRLADRVDRRLNEASEVQRLSEERFRQEWEEYLSDDQKRWRQFTLTNEEAWRENEKAMEGVLVQIAEIRERGERLEEHIKHLSRTYQVILNTLAEQFQSLREQVDDGRGSLPSLP